MNLGNLHKLLRRNVKIHSPIILSVTGAVGTLATAYLASKASIEAHDIIVKHEALAGTAGDRKQRIIERTRLVWRLYIPTGICATSTIVCIVGANRVQAKKTLAAQAAFAITERAYSEYRDKVIQEFGNDKDKSIRDSIAEDRVNKGPAQDIIISGSGSVLCCEIFTGRYFNGDIESLRKAVNQINHRALANDYATFDDFYYLIGIGQTKESNRLGWTSSRLLELEFTSILTNDGTPCLAFDYNYYSVL